MKTRIINESQPKQEINWAEVSLVMSNDTNSILLTSGEHDGHYFNGTVVFSDEYKIGYSGKWGKRRIHPNNRTDHH